MTIRAARAALFAPRALAAAAGALAALALAALAARLAPPSLRSAPVALGLLTLAASLAYAATAELAKTRWAALALALAALALGAAALSGLSGAALEPAFGLGSLAGLAGLAYRLNALKRPSAGAVALALALIIALLAYNAWYVLASRDLEIADFMFFRLASIAVAAFVDSGRLFDLLAELASSMKADYSWAPAILPGLALAAGAPLSRAVYQTALMVFYAAPALLALAGLARELSRRAGLGGASRRAVAPLAFALAAAAAIYPTGLAVAARGMPDIGGLALYVLALTLADRLARVLALPRAAVQAPRLALALVATLFAMFLFRRWYAFAAVGVGVMLGLEIAPLALQRGFAWRKAIESAALMTLTGLGLVLPVLVDWLPNPAAHDYAEVYAAYRKSPAVFVGLIGDWWGVSVLALASLAAALLAWRSRDGRLIRLTVGAALIAALLFLRVQTPYVHHVYLIAPAIIGALSAALLLARPAARLLGLAALAAATLTPAGELAPKGVFPTYGQPHPPAQTSPNSPASGTGSTPTPARSARSAA